MTSSRAPTLFALRKTRAAAITHARTGAEKLWAGTMVVQPDAKTGPHHHGELETVLYVVKGRVRMRWGDHLLIPSFSAFDPQQTCAGLAIGVG